MALPERIPDERRSERHLSPFSCLLVLLTALLILAAGEVRADLIVFRDRFGPSGYPPLLLARARPAVPLTDRVLSLRFTHERYHHPERASLSGDPTIAWLADADARLTRMDLGFGLGHGLTARAGCGWAVYDQGRGTAEGGWSESGFEDLSLALGLVTPFLGGRLRTRIEGGAVLPTGSDRVLATDERGLSLAPFTEDETTGFATAALTLRVTGSGAPLAMHLHAEGTFVDRGRPALGDAFIPFRQRLPLLALGESPYDMFNLRFALSFTGGRGALYAELDLPRLNGAGAVMRHGEMPRTLSPGFALRIRGIEFGAQLDVLFASDDEDTEFDPRLAYPDWGMRIRIGTDLVPHDRDRDGDGIGDLTDRCPRTPEDRDGFADADGCPDPDNDGDLIYDLVDACPNTPEDRDRFEDLDGCPEPDNDGDGIPDESDLCPMSEEDMDGFEDWDGCPERNPEPGADSAGEMAEPAPGLGDDGGAEMGADGRERGESGPEGRREDSGLKTQPPPKTKIKTKAP